MQVNLFKILAITAAFSTVQSAPVETAEGQVTREQVNETHVNEAVVDDAVPQKGCVKEEAPHISTRERVGDIFARACYDYDCYLDSQCKKWGCSECLIQFLPCGDSFLRCH
ncbi:hypothetical protein NW756_006846 [Fusarium oxysporum]|nr:hypothetical protein NW753_012366 [Fusarium oxysporum]KAJ4072361.1 hypothetical protein NW763_001389 [Fusarium oxysporum]KAJ4088451.1 hypothetical protein NW756_006846 [Fusarium oxysporum]KAJ4094498.1 hypothetical protein NW769_012162 [Fusarium oxysporum]KAJ4218624.1 hypothetical protein NW760_012673 [Fusarium oxysporum]